jgi:hypothetical protein
METRPPVVWRALSVVLFVGMFGFSLVKAQGCQREAKPGEDRVMPATKSGMPLGDLPAVDEAPPADAGEDAGADAAAEEVPEVMPATKFGPVFPATKSGPPVRIPEPEPEAEPTPQQQNAPKK